MLLADGLRRRSSFAAPEIDQNHLSEFVDHDVVGRDVPVQRQFFVHIGQCAEDRFHHATEGFLVGKDRAVLLQGLDQRFSVDVFGDHVAGIVGGDEVLHLQNVFG